MVLAAVAAGIATTAPAGVATAQPADAGGGHLTRVDTDAAGNPESEGGEINSVALSGNGRYALLYVRTNSNMVPEPYRTPTWTGGYLVRKDLQTGSTLLVSLKEDGTPQRADWRYGAIGWDGTTFAYSSGDSEEPSLFYRDLSSGVRRVVTEPWRWFIESITLSRDNRSLTWTSLGERSGNRITRHDLVSGETKVLLECGDFFTGCYRPSGLFVSDDATKLVFKYRATSKEPTLVTLLDTTTGALRTLPEATPDSSYRLSGDGKWVFFTLVNGEQIEIRKVSTTPGATPVPLRSWRVDETWSMRLHSVSPDGNLIGYTLMSGNRADKYFASARAHVFDQATGRTTLFADPRPGKTYSTSPVISGNSRVVVVQEWCLGGISCGVRTGWYSSHLGG
ncbi:hypothetical protein ACQPZF_24770 [Actinosynnema sp. CS-041913]|uniref:hypothetical protein n=1 Tax=Actinosynnema sp. CS-041913 TaxID=3239917 RepID=UPI003D8C3AE6